MIGVIGKISIVYYVGGVKFEEIIIINENAEHYLEGCASCKLIIDEVYYVIDTIYGASVRFGDLEEDTYLVMGNETTDFVIQQYSIYGTMKIVMF